ncbi:MAG TPA: sigma factor, partial [Candidatus Polarisedimenticolia bacterium]|nr:sigma factor [Candidatus Polarisedimenticolia bacterium]
MAPAGRGSISDTISAQPATVGEPDEGLEALRAPVRAAIRKVCPARLRHLADDIVQDVLLRLMEIRRRDWGNRPFPASYLYRAAYNATVDEIRRRRNALEGPLPDDVPFEPP